MKSNTRKVSARRTNGSSGGIRKVRASKARIHKVSTLKGRALRYRTVYSRVLKYRDLDDVPLKAEVLENRFYTHDHNGDPLDRETRERRLAVLGKWDSMSNEEFIAYNVYKGYLNPDGSIPERDLRPSEYRSDI